MSSTNTAKVRRATREDRFAIVRMAQDFHGASGLPFEFDPAYAERTALNLMDRGAVFVLDDLTGVLGGTLDWHPCWPVLVASDVLWWVDPASRGRGLRLLRAFERWAKEYGAGAVCIRALRDKAGPILARSGYEPGDTAYFRVI